MPSESIYSRHTHQCAHGTLFIYNRKEEKYEKTAVSLAALALTLPVITTDFTSLYSFTYARWSIVPHKYGEFC